MKFGKEKFGNECCDEHENFKQKEPPATTCHLSEAKDLSVKLLQTTTRALLLSLSTFNCRLSTRLYRFTRKSRPVISAGAARPSTPSIVGAISRNDPPACNGVDASSLTRMNGTGFSV